MYIQSIEIENIRSLKHFKWTLNPGQYAGWHVLLGENGSGKSTVLQSIALALVGEKNGSASRLNLEDWLRKDEDRANIQVKIQGGDLKYHPVIHAYGGSENETADDRRQIFSILQQKAAGTVIVGIEYHRVRQFIADRWDVTEGYAIDLHSGWGWFSAAYGPFRRFTGGNPEDESLFKSHPKLAAHLSVFGEGVALTQALEWLKELKYKLLEENSDGKILSAITKFINQDDFLPYGTQLKEVSSDGIFFEDATGSIIRVENLSDGYRSILSMTFELIRQAYAAYPNVKIFSDDLITFIVPGVVLIDEVDAHLHPTWQRRIGQWFRQHFPNIQFIVTTHSPLVCQAAEVGTVWKLPQPGTDEEVKQVEGQDLNRLLYGDILEAYSTQLFGLTTTRPDSAKDKLERLADLNIKETFTGLTDDERAEQEELRAMMPTVANTTGNNHDTDS